MDTIQTTNRDLDRLAWGAFFVWWGITELFGFLPKGTGAVGIGIILLALNAARSRTNIPTSGFTTTLGILALVFGGLELAGSAFHLPFELPVFGILLIVLGLILFAKEFGRTKNE